MARYIPLFSARKTLLRTAWMSLVVAVGALGMQQWDSYLAATDQANVERLNRMVAEYRQRTGRNPDLNLIELFRVGLTDQRLHKTPYGGTYQIDPSRMMVYNPHRQ
ncbi:MAG: hypothetical protein ACK553_04020 [Planctomycetota bacterium]|jgi:hypothetical protein